MYNNPILIAIIGAVMVATAGAIACPAIIDLHDKAEQVSIQETERIEEINQFIMDEVLADFGE